MTLTLFNLLTLSKEEFKPIKNNFVGLYTCGPTVYDLVHIGNLRTYLFEDILRRTLEFNNFSVTQVMNLTDVEDKIIKKMLTEKKTLTEVTEPFSKAFFKDLEKLNILSAAVYPRATEHIKEMIALISNLLKKDVAYLKDGSVYFSLAKFPDYGKLSKLDRREIKVGARVNVDEYSKENAEDFVLWKQASEGEPSWDAPFGQGRPGWHIECSAMSMKYLGESFDSFGKLRVDGEHSRTIDIHSGAVDLIFPHHENEIAQSEAATGKKFVNYWVEGEHLLVDNQKMSKSLGNIFTLEDIIEKKINPLAFRYLVLTTHYRSKLNFTWESLAASENALNNLYEAASSFTGSGDNFAEYDQRFLEAINDDLDMPKALATVWELIKSDLPEGEKASALLRFDKVLGLGLEKVIGQTIPEEVQKLVNSREELRKNNQFDAADKVRLKIETMGYSIKDAENGTKVARKFNKV